MKIEKFTMPVNCLQVLSEDEDILLGKMRVMNTKESRLVKIGDEAGTTVFTLDSIKKATPTLFNKPIVYVWDTFSSDFTHHATNEYEESMRKIAGVVPESCDPTYVTDEDEVTYFEVVVALWKKYAPEACEKIKNTSDIGNDTNLSMEISLNNYQIETRDDGYPRLIVDDFIFNGICLLGEKVETGMVDANMKVIKFSALENEDYSSMVQKTNESIAAMFSQVKIEDKDEDEDEDELDDEREDEEREDEEQNDEEDDKQETCYEEDQKIIEEKGEGKVNKLLKSQVTEILENATSEQKSEEGYCRFWVEDYDEDYVYLTDKTDNYTLKRAPYVLDTENLTALIDFDNLEKVIRGGYLVVTEDVEMTFAEAVEKVCEAEKKACEAEKKCGELQENLDSTQECLNKAKADYESLKADFEACSTKLADYEAKDKELIDEKAKDIVAYYSQYISKEETESLQAFFSESRDLEKLEEKAKALSFSAIMAKGGIEQFQKSGVEFTGSTKVVNFGAENDNTDEEAAIKALLNSI